MRMTFEEWELECVSTLHCLSTTPEWSIPAHAHLEYELHLVTEGHGVNELRHDRLQLQPGTVYLAPPAETHAQQTDHQHPLQLYYVLFRIRYKDRLLDNMPRIYKHQPIDKGHLDQIRTLHNSESLEKRFQGSVRLMELLWEIVLPEIHHSNDQHLPGFKQTIDDPLKMALQELDHHPDEPFTVEQWAERSHLSPRHLTRLFQARFGTNPQSFLQQQRLKRALFLLKGRQVTVKEVSEQMKFSSPQYFSHWFKRMMGVSPSDLTP